MSMPVASLIIGAIMAVIGVATMVMASETGRLTGAFVAILGLLAVSLSLSYTPEQSSVSTAPARMHDMKSA